MVEIPARGLGRRTLALILTKYGWVIIVPIGGALFAAAQDPIASPASAPTLITIGSTVAFLGMLLALGAIFIGYLEYIHYGIFLDESTFKVTSGIIETEELGVPYRHIHEVKIVRTVGDQLFGVSTLEVVIATEEGEKEKTITLPSLERQLAADIRDALLQKSEIEQLHIASSAI
jgi:uncharacterized membrane protein YdbT with pleckstrin-like domain